MKITKFEDLNIWITGLKITKLIYDVTAKGSFSKDFDLRSQIRRAIISVSSNIVEGFEKRNNNEFVRFLRIAKGSTGEARNQLHVARVVGHISESDFALINGELEALSSQLGAFISYLTKKRLNKEFINK